ncbi:MAG TPA: carboxypeptidase-like regulatory domain-containing protein [Kofleriaceae bacterium]|jgi:hypothetical protein|nr:carboxypeptidase-like regulatory domain-containing protein [Kofleriaceae bacterium]
MTRRSRTALALVAIAIAAWGAARMCSGGAPAARNPPGSRRVIGHEFADAIAISRAPRAKLPAASPSDTGDVTIAGRVIDLYRQQGVGGVEVVFRSASGETSTTSHPDGSYTIRVAPGLYRAFVRDDTVLSVGRPELVRLPGPPSAEAAGVPDEALMAIVLLTRDTGDVDLSVVRGGIVSGHVIDRSGRPIAGAVLRARGGLRPTLATDVAETDTDGSFELRLPAGGFILDASHPRFAGIASAAEARIAIEPGDHLKTTITLTAGCVISGRVVGRDGKPTGDGAIERQWGQGDLEFAPAGQIAPDGTFRWVTTDEVDLTLRAWPWKSPPAPAQRFTCRDGARWSDVVFQVSDQRPDIAGVLVDRAGAPVGRAFLDLQPLDPDGLSQQERTDEAGRWEVYRMPPGRYRITAQAEGRGIATQTVTSPSDGVRLTLGGTGRIEGTVPRLASGSFELVLGACRGDAGMVALPPSRRLVTVTGGRFAIDDVPACELSFRAIWHGLPISAHAAIPSGGTAQVVLDLGPVRAKTVHGIVRDGTGKPVAGARVTATSPGNPDTTATTDATGAYTLTAFSGATVHTDLGGRVGFAQVTSESADSEQLDLTVEDVIEDVDDRAAGDEIED